MKVSEKCWVLALRLLNIISLSPLDEQSNQQPIGDLSHVYHPQSRPTEIEADYAGGPVFSPPNGPDDFFCEYPEMPEWKNCTVATHRGCWLKHANGSEYNISTNYELIMPKGTLRRYWLNVSDMVLQPDGYNNIGGKVFNNSYPGPWIKACWGDDIEITVTNNLKHNGTTIHWHGIRQYNNMQADGVNGVTRCPLAGSPINDSYTYRFKTEQYGSSWYHSHYALQYADGVLGPMTIFGPSSANYDDHLKPILMSDWSHQSAFSLFYQEVTPGKGPSNMANILLNGIGRYACNETEKRSGVCVDQKSYYNATLTRVKKYLLRLINTSVDTTFIFSIDNHNITVIGADFVPIKPYNTTSVLVGIGQICHVVVQATPDTPNQKGAYWIRTMIAQGCGSFSQIPANTTGIIYYEGADNTTHPDTKPIPGIPTACSDEPYDKLIPYVPWQVGKPANQQQASTFDVGIVNPPAPGPLPPPGQFSRWSLGSQPLSLDFSNQPS